MGHLTVSLAAAAGGGTDLTLVYDVGGWTKDGMASFAAPVNQVLADQFGRLAAYASAGPP